LLSHLRGFVTSGYLIASVYQKPDYGCSFRNFDYIVVSAKLLVVYFRQTVSTGKLSVGKAQHGRLSTKTQVAFGLGFGRTGKKERHRFE
jgi:hypothetical protein